MSSSIVEMELGLKGQWKKQLYMEETALCGRNSFNVKGGSHTVHKALKNSLELRKDVFQ